MSVKVNKGGVAPKPALIESEQAKLRQSSKGSTKKSTLPAVQDAMTAPAKKQTLLDPSSVKVNEETLKACADASNFQLTGGETSKINGEQRDEHWKPFPHRHGPPPYGGGHPRPRPPHHPPHHPPRPPPYHPPQPPPYYPPYPGPVPVPGPGPGPIYGLKARLVSVIENENFGRWPRWDRNEAIRALHNYPGDISTHQDRLLRQIYRTGTLHQFLGCLYNQY